MSKSGTPRTAPKSAAERMRRYRHRRKIGAIRLHNFCADPTHLATLIALGHLPRDAATAPTAIIEALYRLLDHERLRLLIEHNTRAEFRLIAEVVERELEREIARSNVTASLGGLSD